MAKGQQPKGQQPKGKQAKGKQAKGKQAEGKHAEGKPVQMPEILPAMFKLIDEGDLPEVDPRVSRFLKAFVSLEQLAKDSSTQKAIDSEFAPEELAAICAKATDVAAKCKLPGRSGPECISWCVDALIVVQLMFDTLAEGTNVHQYPADRTWPDEIRAAYECADSCVVYRHMIHMLSGFEGQLSVIRSDAAEKIEQAFLRLADVVKRGWTALKKIEPRLLALTRSPVQLGDCWGQSWHEVVFKAANEFILKAVATVDLSAHLSEGLVEGIAIQAGTISQNWPVISRALRELPGVQMDRVLQQLRAEAAMLARGSKKRPPSLEPPVVVAVPIWNRDVGRLTFSGEVVKHVRIGVATNVVKVLDSFQGLGWPERIDDPIPGGQNQQRLHETIKSLNEGLTRIHFRADGTGKGFIWERAPSP
jgi:hypothetical protein